MTEHSHLHYDNSHHFHLHQSGILHHHPHGDGLPGKPSRRDFFSMIAAGALAGASVLELAYVRAAWARAGAAVSDQKLFEIQKATDGVYFAYARPQAIINCNAAIFVRAGDVVVVDAHSKPSAAAALVAQIKREVTQKPVRYVVNTHFHWDHTQGNQVYKASSERVDIIASAATKQIMADQSMRRMKSSLEDAREQLDGLRQRAASSKSTEEKAFCERQIRQCEAFLAEMKDFRLELPTITFEKSYVLEDSSLDLQIEFHGRSHTAGDAFVFSPQARAIATGDASHCWLPNIEDGYPRAWPTTIDKVKDSDFKYVLGGHGPMQTGRTIMDSQRNYIEELVEKVEDGKRAGLTLQELQKRLTVSSLKSLQSDGYADFLIRIDAENNAHFGPRPALQIGVDENVGQVYANLDKV